MSEYIMYLRKSRTDSGYAEESVELTLSRHKERLMELCSALSIQCNTILQEVGSADSIAARPEMMRLLQLVETGSYDGVVCIDMDRLSRGSGADQALVINTFKYSDTKVITPQKTYDFSLETDEQFAELSLFLAKQEYRQIKKRLYQGRLDSTKEGKWQSSKAPYGYETYKLKGQKGFSLRIIPEEAAVVRLIFRIYLDEQIGCNAIGEKLATMGYKTRDGRVFNMRHVHTILTNPVYTGKVRFSRYKYCTVIEDGEIKHRTRVNKNPYIYDGLHEPIISEDDFDRAQELLRTKSTNRTHKDLVLINPMTRILRCGYCGGSFKLGTWSVSVGRPMLECKTKGCQCHGAYLDFVEDRMLTALGDWMKDYEFGAQADGGAELQKTITSLSDKKTALNAKLARQMDAYENGVYDLENYRKRSEETKAEIEAINAQIENINKKIDTAGEIIPKIRNVVEVYRSQPDAASKNKLLREIFEKMELKKATRSRWAPDDFELTLYPKLPS